MKYIKILFTVFVLTFCMIQISMVAFANDLYPENTAPSSDNSYYETQPASSPAIEETQPASSPAIEETQPASSPAIEETQPASSPAIDETQNFNLDNSDPVRSISDPVIVAALAPMTPTNTNGFQAVVLSLLGNYNPVVLEYAYTNSNGYVSYVREVQPDFSWMASALIFLVVVYSLFRLIGALIKR